MKIAVFTEAYLSQATAAATHTSILASGLLKLGHDVLIITSDTETTTCYIQDNIVFCPAKVSRNCCGQTVKLTKLSDLNPFLDEFKPNIIHIQTFTELGSAGQAYAEKNNLPLVSTLHDLHDTCTQEETHSWLDKLSTKKCQRIFKKILEASDSVLTPSKRNIPLVQEIVPCKIKNIPFCIDTELFHLLNGEETAKGAMRARLRITEDKVGFVYAGRLCEENEIEALLELWSKSFSITDNLQLIIVGSGRDGELLRRQTEVFGITSNVTFAGNLTRDDLSLCYSVCRAFVSAAVSPTMKASPIEAIATGLPAILPDNSANADILTPAVNGFIYHSDEEFKDLIQKLAALTEENVAQMKKLVARTALTLTDVNLAKAIETQYTQAQKQHKKNAAAKAAATPRK